MTCIVGLVEKGVVYLGGDSAGVSGLDRHVVNKPKVFSNGGVLMGYTTSFRMGQILQYSFKVPRQTKKDDFEYLCTSFVDELRKCFDKQGFSRMKDNVQEGGTFLVGYKGRLYTIYDDFQVMEVVENYDSCGCGHSYARGAFYVLSSSKKPPEEKLRQALGAAAYCSAGVCAPFTIIGSDGTEVVYE